MSDIINNEAVLDATEKTLEVIEGQLDTIEAGAEQVVEVVRNNVPLMIGVGVVGLAAGIGAGYFIGVKRTMKEFDERLESELAVTRAFYANLHKVKEDGTPLTPADALGVSEEEGLAMASLRDYRGEADDAVDEELADRAVARAREMDTRRRKGGLAERANSAMQQVESSESTEFSQDESGKQRVKTERRQVFEDPGFDLDEEQKYRTSEAPYIINSEEYLANELEHEQSQLTYYETDQVLADERDKPLEEALVDSMVGEDHLVRFGSGSGDRNVVFVRNERLGMDFEIHRSEGSFLEEVLALDDEEKMARDNERRRENRQMMRE